MLHLGVQHKESKIKQGTYCFPVELLNSTNQERKDYFKDYVEPNESLERAINKTVSLVTTSASERIVFVCGPSGVGKKELIKGIRARLFEFAEPKLSKNRGFIPVVDIEAEAPIQGSFNFPKLWRTALEKMNEPMLNQKISYDNINVNDSSGQNLILSQKRKADYQEVLQKALKYREVMALIINEAHHTLRISSGKKLNWSVDLIKSLTNLSQTPIIMVGTYDLTTFLEDLKTSATDQINQRTRIVDFPRYSSNVRREVQIFGKVAKELIRHMPLEQTAEELVDEDWMYFYKYTLGCIGSLKLWLIDAYSLALESQAKTLTMEHLEATRISGHRAMGMLQSIEEGEKRMKTIQSEGDIDIKLAFIETESAFLDESETCSSKKNTKPFRRSPKRDSVM